MARRYAPVLCSIWDDPDFQALSEGAQRCYLMLLSQRKLSMVGVLPYTPRAWSRGCSGTSIDDVEVELEELQRARYVVIDYATDELLIRTMVKHDPPRGPKSTVAMWRALEAVDSPNLRREVLRHVPEDIMRGVGVAVPAWVNGLSDAPLDTPFQGESAGLRPKRPETVKPLQDAPSDGGWGGGADGARERAHAATVPPSTSHLPPSSSEFSTSLREAMPDEPRIEAVIHTLADRFRMDDTA